MGQSDLGDAEVSGLGEVFVPPGGTDRYVIYLAAGDRVNLSPLERLLAESRLGAVAVGPRGTWWLPKPVRSFTAAATPEAFVVERVVSELRGQHGARAFGLLGVGMGGQGALRIAFKYPRLFPAVAAVHPWIDFHERYWEDEVLQEVFPDVETARQYTATLWINPLDRPLHIHLFAQSGEETWYRGIERLHEKMLAIGVPHEWTTFEGDPSAYVEPALRWLAPRIG